MRCCFNNDIIPSSIPFENMYKEYTDNLPPSHIEYLHNWLKLCGYELIDSQRGTYYDIKSMPSIEREKTGRCVGHLIYNFSETNGLSYIHHFYHNNKYIFPEESLNIGEYIILSIENKRICVLRGCVLNNDKKDYVIESESQINSILTSHKEIEFRVDNINNSVINYTRSLHNLFSLLIPNHKITLTQHTQQSDEIEKHRKNICSIIVDEKFEYDYLSQSTYDTSFPWNKTPNKNTIYDDLMIDLKSEFLNFNEDQRKSIQRIFNEDNIFSLIQGMPGTGKTTLLAYIIKCFYCIGYKILIMSYTNLAVDNILLKLISSIPVFRIGNNVTIHNKIQPYSSETLSQSLSYSKYSEKVKKSQIVATTCLNITHPLLQNNQFDLCIIDEASQMIEPLTLGPLLISKKFVLVGDHYQLPPLVLSERSKKEGMSISLFERLLKIYPNSLSKLSIQYRMNKNIMLLCNYLIYNNELKCDDIDVENRLFYIHNLDNIPSPISNKYLPWIKDILLPEKSVLFLNTDKIRNNNNLEKKETGKGRYNLEEAEIVSLLLKSLHKCNCNIQDIGVITPYLCQIDKIKQCLNTSIMYKYNILIVVKKY